jgi:hypothetical protein
MALERIQEVNNKKRQSHITKNILKIDSYDYIYLQYCLLVLYRLFPFRS